MMHGGNIPEDIKIKEDSWELIRPHFGARGVLWEEYYIVVKIDETKIQRAF
jgi:hypothetical protein